MTQLTQFIAAVALAVTISTAATAEDSLGEGATFSGKVPAVMTRKNGRSVKGELMLLNSKHVRFRAINASKKAKKVQKILLEMNADEVNVIQTQSTIYTYDHAAHIFLSKPNAAPPPKK